MIKSGMVIGGRYTVIEHVRQGGMQNVYRVNDSLLDIALKTPKTPQSAKDSKLVP
jgi:hypothetical protein